MKIVLLQNPASKTFTKSKKTNESQSPPHFVSKHPVLNLQHEVGNLAVLRMFKSGTIQTQLNINRSGDIYEQEADRVANQVMRMSDNETLQTNPSPINIQKKCKECEEEEKLQMKNESATKACREAPSIVHDVLNSGGHSLDRATRNYFGSRFGYDFSNVKVHTDSVAAKSAQSINALAFTSGNNIVFNNGQYEPHTNNGKSLLAHELTHVVQQKGTHNLNKNHLLQRQPRPQRQSRTTPPRRLELRSSISPCACLVFIHNNERNARNAAETLHQNCRYNLAIIQEGSQQRRLSVPGTGSTVDPNELFPQIIQEECTRNEAGCVAYERSHNDLKAMQIQFFLAIKACTKNFNLPTIALHNNSLNDTSSFRRSTTSVGRQRFRGDYSRDTIQGTGSLNDLRTKLGSNRGLLLRSKTTNIFRWCNLPEIGRCHIGDPDNPDNVIWVTTTQDFNQLQQQNVNVVLQKGLAAAQGTESETDLSTLFLRLGANVRFINIETPISPRNQATRDLNMLFIQQVIEKVGLKCCEPIGDFPEPSRDQMYA